MRFELTEWQEERLAEMCELLGRIATDMAEVKDLLRSQQPQQGGQLKMVGGPPIIFGGQQT